MLELEEALTRILAAVAAPRSESIPTGEAFGRIALERILSPSDLPRFDNSAMDGYAVRSADVASATADAPARLRVAGKVAAGEVLAGEVSRGACARIFTGSALPASADAVVIQEDTRLEAGAPGEVFILEAAKPWENVRLRGEDVKRGAALVEAGARLTAGGVGLLGAAGVANVSVGRRPIVGLLATGSELIEPGGVAGPGKIYESNRMTLAALARSAGALPKALPLVPDEPRATRTALEQAFEECDVVATSGGVSVGEMDFVKRAFEEAGGKLDFWRVAIRPGRPFVFGRRGNKLLFGLPGNPVSAFVTFLMLVRPALLRWQGAEDTGPRSHRATLAEPLANRGSRRHFMRVRVDSAGMVSSAGTQESHAMSSLAAANALVDVPPETTLEKGRSVPVLRWD